MCVPECLSSENVEAVVVPPALHARSYFIRGDERETAQSLTPSHSSVVLQCSVQIYPTFMLFNYCLSGEDGGEEEGAAVPHYSSWMRRDGKLYEWKGEVGHMPDGHTVKENTVGVHVWVFQHASMRVLIQYVLPVKAPAEWINSCRSLRSSPSKCDWTIYAIWTQRSYEGRFMFHIAMR